MSACDKTKSIFRLRVKKPSSEPDLECAGYFAHELGAVGTALYEPDELDLFFEGTVSEVNEVVKHLELEGFTPISDLVKEDPDSWYSQGAGRLEPLVLHGIKILPVLTEAEGAVALIEEDKIVVPLITSTGFGTGHHPTTAMMVEFLQHERIQSLVNELKRSAKEPVRILDLGTGSGILGISVCRLYDVFVDAVDTDPLAIRNARDNVSLNKEEARIRLIEGDMSSAPESGYPLIIANIYAEVLCSLEEDFGSRLSLGLESGEVNDVCPLLLLSGILGERIGMIKDTFSAPHWEVLEERSVGEWSAILLGRERD